MHTALIYFLILTSLVLVAGGVIAFVAMRNAPDGFENEEGFVGITKGDELLLKEFSQHRYTGNHPHAGLAA